MRIVEGRLIYSFDWWIGHSAYLLIREKDLLPLLTPKERKEWKYPLVKSWWIVFWKIDILLDLKVKGF